MDVAWQQISPGAMETGTGVPHDYMMAEATIKEPGYAYIYISNENPTLADVYFDDVKITHTKTPVLQYNEYYPFGLQTANSWTRENTTNDFLYNAGTELNATSGYYETPFRSYDAALGRFMQVDALAPSYGSQTPYNYANNDPVYFSDPTGLYGQGDCSWCSPVPSRSGNGEIMDPISRQPQIGSLFDGYTGGSFTGGWGEGYGSAGIARGVSAAAERYFDRAGGAAAITKRARDVYQLKLTLALQRVKFVNTFNQRFQPDAGSPYPPTKDLIKRFGSSVDAKLLSKLVELGLTDAAMIEESLKELTRGENYFDDLTQVPPYPNIVDDFGEPRVNPWSYQVSIFLTGYDILGFDSGGTEIFHISNPFYHPARRENLIYENDDPGYGAPYWTVEYSSEGKTIRILTIFNISDPGN